MSRRSPFPHTLQSTGVRGVQDDETVPVRRRGPGDDGVAHMAELPEDPAAAAEEIQRRREEIGYSYFVWGAGFADGLGPAVARIALQ